MIRLSNPTGRNTQAHLVEIRGREYFFSYETCIAFRGFTSNPHLHSVNGYNLTCVRVANTWGPTTGRHFQELGCAGFEVVDPATFEKIVEGSL